MHIERIIRETDLGQELFLTPCAVALGSFDGLHKGHMKLICDTVKYARANSGVKSCVFTFTSTLGNSPCITSNEQRTKILKEHGVDFFVMQEFNSDFRNLSPVEFFEIYIKKALNAKMVVSGFNYRFGHLGKGDNRMLKELCSKNGIEHKIIAPVLYLGKPISSTRIRAAVRKGDLLSTKQMLGRGFSVLGKVVEGDKIGRILGFPTANIEIDSKHVMPPVGVYATKVLIDNASYSAITNFGGKPTIKEGIESIESHILDFEGDLYGKTIEVCFIQKIRDTIKFTDKTKLIEQLKKDKQTRRQIL
ncbi:MAG: bifunctional riboflavin kinase/FAD synthetase [Eubacteriales bacterium]|jgi:riboflavin kinase/FMN adenylyltransferase|nr:bifunctional riboflavin kinase/FAD synthetase [Eubacteriales bacterium]